jgi:hypothetical protein
MNIARLCLSASAAVLLLGMTGFASAAPLLPTSQDMPNGSGQASGGSFNYWDLSYTGAGATNVDGAALSGGLGGLTDGALAGDNWLTVENGAGTGLYTGGLDIDPTITFNFAGSVSSLHRAGA